MKSKIIYEPNIELKDGMVAPDSWHPHHGVVLPDDFVICRNRSGQVVSRYGDSTWDRSHYHPSHKICSLVFAYWGGGTGSPQQQELSRELRHLMSILMYKRPDSVLKNKTLQHYLSTFRALAVFAEINGCRIQDILNSENLLKKYTFEITSANNLRCLPSYLKTLYRLGKEDVGFSVLSPIEVSKITKPIIGQYKGTIKQRPPIPTRIYSLIISALKKELDDWEAVEERYLAMFRKCLSDPLVGRSHWRQRDLGGRGCIKHDDFNDLLRKHDLEVYFEEKGLTRKIQGLVAGLGVVQEVARKYVITFSGVRSEEALNIPYYCLKTELGKNGKIYFLISGVTTKLFTSLTQWVTNTEGHRAIGIAQRIADVIYEEVEEEPSKKLSVLNRHPLFVSSGYLQMTGKKRVVSNDTHYFQFVKTQPTVASEALLNRILPLIEDEDLDELEMIEPHRGWRSEDAFQVGQRWPLTDHQLRRSLALYAQSSGLVSLPSLRRQLQHITEDMSRYYARGSQFAKNIIGDNKDHFGREWQSEGTLSSALSYMRDVIFREEPVAGGHVKWMDHQLSKPDGIVLRDRDATIKDFRRGLRKYKETPVGGCASLGDCKGVAIRFLDADCMKGCANQVLKLHKLNRCIELQTVLVNSLNPNNIEFRTESADLEVMIATRDSMLQDAEVKHG